MPLGRAFNQSLQGALDRAQQRKAERATQRFRQQQLQQRAEQARAQRQQEQRQFRAQQEQEQSQFEAQQKLRRDLSTQGTVEVDRGDVDFLPGQGAARLDADTVAGIRSSQNQSDARTIGVPRSDVGLPGEGTVEMTPGSFANLRATQLRQNQQPPTMSLNIGGETQQVPIPKRVIARKAIQKMRDNPDFNLPTFGGAGSGQSQPSGQSQTGTEEATVPTPRSEAGDVLNAVVTKYPAINPVANLVGGVELLNDQVSGFFTPDVDPKMQKEFQDVGRAASESFRTALSSDANPAKRKKALTQGLVKTQRSLARLKGVEENEQVKRLRAKFKALQDVGSQLQSGNSMDKGLKVARKRLLDIMSNPDASDDAVTGAVNEYLQLRKQTDQ